MVPVGRRTRCQGVVKRRRDAVATRCRPGAPVRRGVRLAWDLTGLGSDRKRVGRRETGSLARQGFGSFRVNALTPWMVVPVWGTNEPADPVLPALPTEYCRPIDWAFGP